MLSAGDPALTSESLRYLGADAVMVSAQPAEGMEVRTADRRMLGYVQGILVEPASRRARYYVVDNRSLLRRRRYLVPADRLATLDPRARTIFIDVSRSDVVLGFDESRVPRFSDDDLIATLFSPAAGERGFGHSVELSGTKGADPPHLVCAILRTSAAWRGCSR